MQNRSPSIAAAAALSLILALLIGLAQPGPAAAAATAATAVVRAGGVELLDAPGGRPILALPMGTRLDALGRSADCPTGPNAKAEQCWLLVATRSGQTGWAPAERLVAFAIHNLPVQAAQPTASRSAEPVRSAPVITATVTTVNQGLNVRAGPGLDYPIVGVAAPGQALTVTGRNAAGDWLQIEPADGAAVGWVAAAFAAVSAAAADLPIVAAASAAPPPAAATGLTGKLAIQTQDGTIVIYDLAAGRSWPLTPGADPAISPDGKTVAFWRQEGGQHALYTIAIGGGEPRRILTRAAKLRTPAWNPDGSAVAFSHVNGQDVCRDAGYGICLPDIFPYNRMFPAVYTDRWGLAAVAADGSGFRDLPALKNATSPDWSEAGLLYAAGGIQRTRADGGADASRGVLTEPRFRDPAWQPGGDRIVFQSLEKDHWEIFAAAADGSGVTALTRPATTLVPKLPHNVAPTWSPDGRAIAFVSNRDGAWAIWVMDADGGNQRKLPINVALEYRFQGEQMLSWGK